MQQYNGINLSTDIRPYLVFKAQTL